MRCELSSVPSRSSRWSCAEVPERNEDSSMALDASKLAKDMLAAVLPGLKAKASSASLYADMELKKIAQTVALIEKASKAGQITEEEAKLLLDMQKVASHSVLTTLEGVGILAAEQAINTALAAVRAPINAAVGWVLI